MLRIRTVKKYGFIHKYFCTECSNEVNAILMRITDWYTLLIIPIWPMYRKYVIYCPKCQAVKQIEEDEFKRLVTKFKQTDKRVILDETFEGKTHTQINYLREMDQIRKEKEKVKNIVKDKVKEQTKDEGKKELEEE